MTRNRRPPHTYLTDTERKMLSIKVSRAARHMPPADGNQMIGLFQHMLADLQHARATATGTVAKLDHERRARQAAEEEQRRLRALLGAAEDELAVHRQRAVGRLVEDRPLVQADVQP